MIMDPQDLRADQRFRANAPYTRVVVHPEAPAGSRVAAIAESKPSTEGMEGHAYDVSAHGLRFELDQAVPTGSRIDFELELPGCVRAIRGKGRVVRVFSDEDDPGPRRMAAHIEEFESEHDRMRLAAHLEDHWIKAEA
ncbi:MAG: PilZ domain-containing protein [Planctomycetota bacterium]|nr:PilZ domain-containing protein [Planctomycetota bacterium]MDA1105480.1 PilZ domain-containing protein [Planctomycetota bacterium]